MNKKLLKIARYGLLISIGMRIQHMIYTGFSYEIFNNIFLIIVILSLTNKK